MMSPRFCDFYSIANSGQNDDDSVDCFKEFEVFLGDEPREANCKVHYDKAQDETSFRAV